MLSLRLNGSFKCFSEFILYFLLILNFVINEGNQFLYTAIQYKYVFCK